MSDSVIDRVARSRAPSIRTSRAQALANPVPQVSDPPADTPVAVAPILPGIFLPQDHYLHRKAPAEWWWHTGTLQTEGGRTFGFEINAASFEGRGYGFTQIMLTDVHGQKHYQATAPYAWPLEFEGSLWAEYDVTLPWYVKLGSPLNLLSTIILTNAGSGYTSPPTVVISGGGGTDAFAFAKLSDSGTVEAVVLMSSGKNYTALPTVTLTGGGGSGATARAAHTYVEMTAPWPDPSQNMKVKALLNDQDTGTEVRFDLSMSQYGAAFPVWGTGVAPMAGTHGTHLETNLYYYSLPNMHAMGTIAVGSEVFKVKGVTWMDHEYGYFGKNDGPTPTWILQDMQLDNGYCISNSASASDPPKLGVPIHSHATVQDDEGNTQYVRSRMVMHDGWPDANLGPYFLTIHVEIPDFQASLTVHTLMPDQLLRGPGDDVYEGVARVRGMFLNAKVEGTAWNEQALPVTTAG